MLKVIKETEERKAHRGNEAPWDQRERRVLAQVLVPLLLVEDRREKRAQRGALASDTPVIRANVGLRGLRGPLVLQDLQLKWLGLATARLCSR